MCLLFCDDIGEKNKRKNYNGKKLRRTAIGIAYLFQYLYIA